MSERSESIAELAAALVKAQGEFSVVPKGSDNPFFKSKYADLADVVKVAGPVLSANGLAVTQFPSELEGSPALTTFLLHQSGQFISDTMRLLLTKSDSQGHGSAMTYARRYAYMAALGLVADVDDDGNAASQRSAPARQQQRPQPERQQAPDEAFGAEPAPARRSPGLATSQQQKAVYAIARKRGLEIPDTKKMTWDEASAFIQEHGDAAA